MTKYNVRHVTVSDPTIGIDEQQIDQSTDITLFGRRKLQYGELMNQNMLHLLENFALPEIAGQPGRPDLSLAAVDQVSGEPFLSNPTLGQMWFNKTQKCLFFWNGSGWQPISMYEDIAANWGIIYDGQTLPKPVSTTTGHVFDYDECSWIVSPYNFPQELQYMLVRSDAAANVTSIYSVSGDPTLVSGFATYLIVGIRGNVNLGTLAPVPSPTPTPAISATPTPTHTRTPIGGTPTSTPTPLAPTPTPTPSTVFSGPLTVFASNPDGFGGFYDGQVSAFYPGDGHAIKYPGTTIFKFGVNYVSDGAPRNPWDTVAGEHYVYINKLEATGITNFPNTDQNYNKMMLFSNDGVNGLVYKIKGITAVGGTMYQLNIDTSSGGSVGSSLFNRPPQETGPLAFNFQFGYLMETYMWTLDNTNTLCQILSPSPYQQSFDLHILGGQPPYNITDIRHGSGSFPIFAIASGVTGGTVPRTNFANIEDIAASFTGPVSLSNPNVSLESNGYKFANFLTADLHYPHPAVAPYHPNCPPEYLWHYCYNYPPVFTDTPCAGNIEAATGCANFTGNQANTSSAFVTVEVTDAHGTVITAALNAAWQFQTIDYKFPNTSMGFLGTPCGRSAGTLITTAGTYYWPVNLAFTNDPTSTEPVNNPSQLKYVFSIVKPATTTNAGDWSISAGDSNKLSTLINGGCYSSSADNSKGLVHISDDSIWSSGGSPLTPWNGSTGNIQTISLLSYVDTGGSVVNISGNPIIVRFYPYTGSNPFPSCPAPGANTFTWNALKADGSNNNSNWTTPQVPYDMVLDVTFPAGLTQPGSLTIPIITWAYEFGGNCFAFGQSGNMSLVQMNFAF